MDEKKRCDISIVPKGKDDWTLELSGDCGDALQQLKDLPPRRRRYARARDDMALKRFIQPLLDYFEGKAFNPSLPLDIHRTAFQWRVYKAIQSIPPGGTTTYSEIAKKIESPKAVRAVGQACSSNPVSILVPCHRVIQKDGGLGGYRWGVGLKEKLLRHESGS